jgi:dCTP diphosphatase
MGTKTTIKQSDDSFESISSLIWQYLAARDWVGNSPRSYAASISIEAAELLEHYQWSEEPVGGIDAVTDELADVMIYCFEFAQRNDIDLANAIKQKMAKAVAKYPLEQFNATANKANPEKYYQTRDAFRQKQKP